MKEDIREIAKKAFAAMLNPREPLNEPERLFCEMATKLGFKCVRRGWPDFWAVDESGRVIFAEVKPTADQPLKASQDFMLAMLSGAGFECYKYAPQTGLVPYSAELSRIDKPIPAPRKKRRRAVLRQERRDWYKRNRGVT